MKEKIMFPDAYVHDPFSPPCETVGLPFEGGRAVVETTYIPEKEGVVWGRTRCAECQAQETNESGEDVGDHLRGEETRNDWELSQRPLRRGELD